MSCWFWSMWKYNLWEPLRSLLFCQMGFNSDNEFKSYREGARKGQQTHRHRTTMSAHRNPAQNHFQIVDTLSNGLKEHPWSRLWEKMTSCSACLPSAGISELWFEVLARVPKTVVIQVWRDLGPDQNTYNLMSSCTRQRQLLETLSV